MVQVLPVAESKFKWRQSDRGSHTTFNCYTFISAAFASGIHVSTTVCSYLAFLGDHILPVLNCLDSGASLLGSVKSWLCHLNCVTLNELLDLPLPCFLHLEIEDNDHTYFIGLMWGLKGWTHCKALQRECMVNNNAVITQLAKTSIIITIVIKESVAPVWAQCGHTGIHAQCCHTFWFLKRRWESRFFFFVF